MRLFTEMQTVTGGVAISHRNMRRTLVLAAVTAAIAASTQILPTASALTPGGSQPGMPSSFTEPIGSVVPFTYQSLIDSTDTFSVDAIVNDQAAYVMHAWRLLPSDKFVG